MGAFQSWKGTDKKRKNYSEAQCLKDWGPCPRKGSNVSEKGAQCLRKRELCVRNKKNARKILLFCKI